MNIQSITTISPINFTRKNERRTNVDRAVTVADLYEMEDRINAKIEKQIRKMNEIGNEINDSNSNLIKDQNKIIGNAFEDMTKLIYFRPLASSHDYYKTALKSSEVVKNNGIKQ